VSRILALAIFVLLMLPVPGRTAAFVDVAASGPAVQMARSGQELSRFCPRGALAKLATACPFAGAPGTATADSPALALPSAFVCPPHPPAADLLAPLCRATPPRRPPRQPA
jgi:hypothetical protein